MGKLRQKRELCVKVVEERRGNIPSLGWRHGIGILPACQICVRTLAILASLAAIL